MQFPVASLIIIGAASVAASPVTGDDNGRLLGKRELVGYTADGQAAVPKLSRRGLVAYKFGDSEGQPIGQRDAAAADGSEDEAESRLVLLRRDERGNGTGIEYYGRSPDLGGAAADVQPTSTVQQRAPKCDEEYPTPSCDTEENQAQNALCANLLGDLSAQSTEPVDPSWRSICFRGESGSCCTTWSDPVPGMQQGDLTPEAQKILERCSSNGISGKLYGVTVAHKCINQCLNSGHKCS